MKFLILGDTHWGCRNDLTLFYGHFEKFYDELIDFCLSNKIDTIFQLGDLFDRRKYINFRTLKEAKRIFFHRLAENSIKMYTLVGNHDIHLRETVEINSPSLVLAEYYPHVIDVITEPTTVHVDGTSIDMIPWICNDNEKQIMEFIANSKSDLCFGHFEIESFSMYPGIESHDGLPVNMFEKYERVCSGHYHTKSQKGNITYVGTPYQMTWQDYGDLKGFHVFDTETRTLEFHQNPHTIFVRLDYDDTKDLVDLSAISVEDCFVKLVVTNKTDLYKFDQFIQRLYNKGCYELKIVEDLSEFTDGEVGESINIEDTVDVLGNYIDSIETSADKDKIKQFIKTLYVEALNVEVV